MKRRAFFKNLLLSSFSAYLTAKGVGGRLLAELKDRVMVEFDAALQRHPFLLGFKGTQRESFPLQQLRLEGKIPGGLEGTLYRNGPARRETYGMRYHHFFDGDGMINAYQIQAGRVFHQAKLVQTRKFLEEKRAGKALYPGFGSPAPGPIRLRYGADSMNMANVSTLYHAGKLFALWEAGSFYEIAPNTLDTIGEHHFSKETAHFPQNPHPRLDEEGTLWNVGYSLAGRQALYLYQVEASGKLKRWKRVKQERIAYFHDFIVTKNYLVLPLNPLRFGEIGDQPLLYSYDWEESAPMEVLVFDKATLELVSTFALPNQFVFHYSNGYEAAPGVIRYEACSYPSGENLVLKAFREVMRGDLENFFRSEYSGASYVQTTLNLNTKRASQETLSSGRSLDFPTVAPALSGRRHTKVVTVENDRSPQPQEVFFNRVTLRDLAKQREASYVFPSGINLEEHLYVSNPAMDDPERGGWVIGTALDFLKKKTQLTIFEADTLEQGPVAVATLPYPMPYGFHGKFVSQV